MSGEVTDREIRIVAAALPHAGTKCASPWTIASTTRMHPLRVIKVLLCMRAKGLAWHTEPQDVNRRRWRMA